MTSSESSTNEIPMGPVQFCRVLGIDKRTLQRWQAKGLVKPAFRTPMGHARYTSVEVAAAKALGERTPDTDTETAATS
jgi:predicted site-specific integrase-resolvase